MFHLITAILALYLRNEMGYTEVSSTAILHVFNFFGQFCPILGAIIADSYLGDAKTILYFLFIYGAGWIGMSLVSFSIGGELLQ